MQNHVTWLRKVGNSFSLKICMNRSDPLSNLVRCWTVWSRVLKQWPWPRFFETLRLCLGFDIWLEPMTSLQCLIYHLPMLLPPSFLFWLLVTLQLRVKALPFPKCFPTSCTIMSITSLAICLKSLVLGGLLWQLSSSVNFFFAGIHLYVCWGREVSVCMTEKHKGCFTSCKHLWLASYVLLFEVLQF